ncbi:FeoA family protein [Candidatus Foliamicus sp.]
MTSDIGLNELPDGSSARIISILGNGQQARALLTLGLVPGVAVRVLRRALGGDPLEIAAGGHPLCLRREQARQVRVAPPSEPS